MLTMDRPLRHMAWANAQVFAALTQLPWSAMAAHGPDAEWTAGRIIHHIVNAAGRYAYRLGMDELPDVPAPTSMNDVRALASRLARWDALLLEAAGVEDAVLEFEFAGAVRTARRSTILAQAVHHATEHRAQLMDALAIDGHHPIALDDIDLWSFEYAGF